ncbi:MAG: hypothetical protein ACTSWQ_02430, partial [Candidatus Thorarchaeota archaeon]
VETRLVAPYHIHCRYLTPRLGKTKAREAEDKDNFSSRRRSYMVAVVEDFIAQVGSCRDILVCLEGYAVDSKSPGLLEMAEISGIIRNYLWEKNVRLRVHDPMSVKLWGCGNAYAKKMHMVNAARRAGLVIPQELLGDGDKFKNPIDVDGRVMSRDFKGPGTDIADAFHLATMGRYELLIKRNEILLEEQPKDVKRVMERTTKANPVNLLNRLFIVATENGKLVGQGTTGGS